MNLGKLVRLRAMADQDNRFQLVDLREAGANASVAELLSSQAGAVLLDPRVGLPAASLSLDRGCRLVYTLGTDAIISGWSPLAAQRAGAAALHLAVTSVDSAPLVEALADESDKLGMPLLLELATPPDQCAEAAEQLLPADVGVDLLAIPTGAVAPEDGWPRPWLLTDRGASGFEPWLVDLRAASQACGFQVGPTLLADLPDDDLLAELWLADAGLWRLRRALLDGEKGRSWVDHPYFVELELDVVNPDWFKK